METPPLPHIDVNRRTLSLRRTLTQALVLSLLPLGTAFAQANQALPFVRVTRDQTEISSLRITTDVRMTAPKGAILEVIYIEGDRYQHRASNWYWVLLPRDPWATRPAGWVRGKDIEHVAPAAAAASATTPLASSSQVPPSTSASIEIANATRVGAAPERAPVDTSTTARAVLSDVILNFPFGRSELTDDAKRKLSEAIAAPKPNARMSVALEGYADWVGTEGYNEQLGLARAESVRRYLADQLRIPAGQISVVSYGEANPAAPNTTREGRAQNRRVVIKVGA
jgi:outer membrane protein OmpA-like peptidoglycan-associated protein